MWPPPDAASDLVKIGDLVRIKLDEEGDWELGQVPEVQGALVSMSPKNGAILALVGGYDFRRSQVNRVTTLAHPVLILSHSCMARHWRMVTLPQV